MARSPTNAPDPLPPLVHPTAADDARLRRVLERLPAAAYLCDADGLITYFNPRAVQLWGREPALHDPADRFCGSFRLFTTGGDPIPHEQCWMALALRDGREYQGHEIVIERPDGSRWVALAHANPFLDEAGNVMGAVNVLVDITERKRAEETLREADRRKSEFLAQLAHELRNPLSPIHSAVRVLQLRGSEEPELQWCRDVLERQVNHLTRLVDDLLDTSRIARDRLELRREHVELAAVMTDAVESIRPMVAERDHRFDVTLPAAPIVMLADPLRLAQVIINLVANAVKYTEPGGHITLTAEPVGGEVEISVRDTGIGIHADQLPRLFEMFYQAPQAEGGMRGGLGVGLALVRRLVELHGGQVTAASDGPGTGSTFTVRLPMIAAAVLAQPPRPRHERSPERHGRVLVVDDNEDGATALATLLGMSGFHARVVHDGPEAIEVAEQFRPDVVLLDIGLPTFDGHEACRRLRQHDWGREMVIVALTGWGQPDDRRLTQEAGFDHHLVKPVNHDELLEQLSSWCEARTT